MTLQQLKYVITVAETRNISKAAEKVYISQPSLTAAIHQLEDEMGIKIFSRTNKGVEISKEGEEFLSYARQVIEQTNLLEERFAGKAREACAFSVSCQHYSFAVNAFVDVINEYGKDRYNFTLRETQTYEIIEDVSSLKSEIGVIYLNKNNQDVIEKLLKKNDLIFTSLFTAKAHVFISDKNPLRKKDKITLKDLQPYPYLIYEQGEHNSFYFAEEPFPTDDVNKTIMVRDRATLFNLLIGLNGYTVCSGVISKELNGKNIIAKPLDVDLDMNIGIIIKRNYVLFRYAKTYLEAIKKYIK